MSDFWDSELAVKIMQAMGTDPDCLKLIFSMNVDGFNPRGKASGPSVSTQLISLVCLNLPPEERYQARNQTPTQSFNDYPGFSRNFADLLIL